MTTPNSSFQSPLEVFPFVSLILSFLLDFDSFFYYSGTGCLYFYMCSVMLQASCLIVSKRQVSFRQLFRLQQILRTFAGL